MKKLCIVFLIIICTAIGCNTNDSVSNSIDYSSIDTKLKSQQYTYTTTPSSKSFSVIIINSKDQSIKSIKDYTITNNDSLDISIDNGDYLIVSLPTNETITYSWNIVNTIENNSFKLNHISSIHLPPENIISDDKLSLGTSFDRQIFYFSTSNISSHSIDFEYSSTTYKSTDNFKITINISII